MRVATPLCGGVRVDAHQGHDRAAYVIHTQARHERQGAVKRRCRWCRSQVDQCMSKPEARLDVRMQVAGTGLRYR